MRQDRALLMSRAEHGCEDLLGLGTVRAAVAAADFAHDDGRANRVLITPVVLSMAGRRGT